MKKWSIKSKDSLGKQYWAMSSQDYTKESTCVVEAHMLKYGYHTLHYVEMDLNCYLVAQVIIQNWTNKN